MSEFQDPPPVAPPAAPVTLPYALPTGRPEPEREMHIVTKILVILALVGSIAGIASAVTRGGNARLVGMATGNMMALLIAWLIALLLWRICGRSNVAYNITLSLLICLFGLGMIGNAARQSRQKAVTQAQLANLNAQASAVKQESLRALAESDDENTEFVDKFISTIDNVSATTTGNDKIIVTAVSKVLKKLVRLDADAQIIHKKYEDAGYDDVSTMPTKASIDARLSLLDEVIAAQRAVTNYRYAEQVIIECRKNGVPPTLVQQLNLAITTSPDYPDLKFKDQFCELTLRWLEKSREALALLRDQYGRWEFNPAIDMIEFEDDPTLLEYQRLTDAAYQAVDDQDALVNRRMNTNP